MTENPTAADVARLAQQCEIKANILHISGYSYQAKPYERAAVALRDLYAVLADSDSATNEVWNEPR